MSDQLQFHPLADIFPLMEGAEFDELVVDIKANGLHEDIVLYEGKIIDGRNRYRACLAADVPAITYNADKFITDPAAYVVSANIRRRHLTESQRAMVAAKLATLKQGARTDISPTGEMSQADAAELLNVGKRSVERAADVRDRGAPELQQAVERGEVSVSAAADVATLPAAEQREVVARGEREILDAAKKIRARKAEARHTKRTAKLVEASRADAPLPSDRRYPVIYADPPWKFQLYNGPDYDRSPDYPAMETEQICAMPIADIATPDAVLFMWTTPVHLPDALRVLEAWGFEHVTNVVWVKDKPGLGHWVRNQHELLIIARRGDMPTPLPANRPPSVINAQRREHSRKPDEAYEMIERMFPDLPRIELFARSRRPGWDAWGNETEKFAAAIDRSIAEDRAWWIGEEIRTLEEKCEAPLAGRSTSEPKRAADDQIALDRNELAAEATP
jgi:N6-adenosine-specific RNA methylase IME4